MRSLPQRNAKLQKTPNPWSNKKKKQNYLHQIDEASDTPGKTLRHRPGKGASNNEVSSTPHCGALWNECIMMKLVEMPSNNHPWYRKESQKFHKSIEITLSFLNRVRIKIQISVGKNSKKNLWDKAKLARKTTQVKSLFTRLKIHKQNFYHVQ